MSEKHKKDSQLFFKLRDWSGYFDSTSYAHAVNESLPYLAEDEVVFLWKRAVAESQSDDYEHQWFGEITLGNIVAYLPVRLRSQSISELDLNTLKNQQVKAILLLHLSQFSTGKTKSALQKRAWTCSASHCNDPINNPSTNHAAFLKWKNEKDGDEHQVWIDTIIDMYEGEIINDIWKDYITQAKSGEIEQKNEFVSQIFHLSRKITEGKIHQACYDCFEVYRSAGRIEETGKTISLLIGRLPETHQAKTWKSVIEFGLKQDVSSVSLFDPKKLAKHIEKIMPNHLWLNTMQ